jgi:hypothetical protein
MSRDIPAIVVVNEVGPVPRIFPDALATVAKSDIFHTLCAGSDTHTKTLPSTLFCNKNYTGNGGRKRRCELCA